MDATFKDIEYSALDEYEVKPAPLWKQILSKWWALTASPIFLESLESGRSGLIIILPLLACIGIIYDCYAHFSSEQYPVELTVCDCILVACLTAIARLCSYRSICTDVLMVGVVGLYFVCITTLALLPPASFGIVSLSWSTAFAVTGTHSTVKLVFFTLLVLLSSVCQAQLLIPSVCAVFACAVVAEYRSASQCARLQEQHGIADRLLENASDGRVSVSAETGAIVEFDAKFGDTLGTHELLGKPLLDFVSPADHGRLNNMYNETARLGEYSPIFVEFRYHGGMAFDVKVIPFAISDNALRLCIRLEGEAFRQDGAPEASSTVVTIASGDDLKDQRDAVELDADKIETLCSRTISTEMQTDGICFGSSEQPSCSEIAIQTEAVPAEKPSDSLGTPRAPGSPRGSGRGGRPPLPLERPRKSRSRSAERDRSPALEISDTPMISGFDFTDDAVVANSLHDLVAHWNLPRAVGSTACCPKHVMLRYAKSALAMLQRQPCEPLWSPLTDWQCRHCNALNGSATDTCGICCNEYTSSHEEEDEVPRRLIQL